MVHAREVDPPSCPTPEALAAFLCGELPPTVMDEIGAHVSSCRKCDAAVCRMDEATDAGLKDLWEHLRNRRGEPPPTDSEYRRMVEAAQALAPTRTFPPAEPQHAPPPSQLGQYRIRERLGQGGMGAVYRAEHIRLKKAVAVKILSPSQTRDPRAVARFQLEMEVVGRLDHPNIVRATDAGEVGGIHFLVMELINGVNLSHLLYRCGPLPIADACELVRQAAVGLQCAHELGLVHRDVKPSNLMLSANGQVKLLDLGLALLRGSSDPGAGDLTGIGEVMGTAEYMAPEQWAETHSVDIRADIYSLGCTLYALLAGEPPFTGSGRKSFLRMMSAHQQKPVRPITECRPEAPVALCELLQRMLAKNPADRPATPGEVAAELERLAIGANVSALLIPTVPGAKTIANVPRPGNGTPTPTPISTELLANGPVRRWRWPLVVVLVAATTATAAGIYFVVSTLTGMGVGTGASAGAGTGRDNEESPSVPREEPPDPKKWRNLLAERHDEQRLRRLWRDDVVMWKLEHNRATEVLRIDSTGPALVRLGEAPMSAYKVVIGLRQIQWNGRIGAYFAGRVLVNHNPPTFAFQFVQLSHIDAKGAKYGLRRGFGQSSLEPKPRPTFSSGDFATEYIQAPGNEEKLLELEMKPGGLAAVRWGGVECPKLADQVNKMALAAVEKQFPDGAGEFGIFCNGSSVVVSTARYIPIE